MPTFVPPIRTARTSRPVRIHSANPVGGGWAPFTPDALRQVVSNWQRFQSTRNPAFPTPQATYIPPADVSLGHDHDQLFAKALLGRTDLPSCGQPVKVWTDGADLFAELDGIPETVAAMCNGGQFKEVSAEIYPNYRTPDGKYHGPVLRRIALLGSSPPRQKGLGGLPPMVYSFAETSQLRGLKPQQVCIFFSEGPFMDKAAALAILQAAGIDVTPWQNADDALVIAFAQFIQSQNPPNPNPAPAAFSEQIGRAVNAALASQVLPAMREMTQRFGSVIAASEEQECVTFAETHVDQLFPFESDPKSPHYIVQRLKSMTPAARKVEMAVIEARPKQVLKFAEQMGDGTGTGTGGRPPNNGAVSPDRVKQLLALTPGGQNIARRNAAQRN